MTFSKYHVGVRHLSFLMKIVLGEDYVRSAPAQHDNYYTVIPLNIRSCCSCKYTTETSHGRGLICNIVVEI